MTKRSFKYLLLAGLCVGVVLSGQVRAESTLRYSSQAVDTVREIDYFKDAFKELSDPGKHLTLWPVIDITSVPAHAVVGVEQKLIRKRTRVEDDLKDEIRRRLSLRKKRELTTEVSQDEESTSQEDPKVVDGKLSKIEIKTSDATCKAKDGLVGKGTDDEIEEDGQSTARNLADKQREGYTSSAGSLSEQEKYALKRQYQEQEEAIRMLALAATLRKSIDDKLVPLMDAAEGHYNKTNVKKDLDPKNKKDEVRSKQYEEADQNQMLRDYAYFSVIYDQLLSLEQQVMGLRLQARGGLSEQKTEPVVEIDYTDE